MYLKLTKEEAAQLVKAGLEAETSLIALNGTISYIEITITQTGVNIELELEEPDKD